MEAKAIIDQKIAIVGMDIYFNACESLAAFERSIYEGAQIAALHSDKKTFSASSQLKSIFQVASNALQDARISKGTKITVIVATEQDSLVNSIANQIGDCEASRRYRFNSTSIVQENSVFKAISKAQELLVSKEVDTVLIIASTDNETVGALVLKLSTTAKQEQNRIYAMIAAIAFSSEGVQACQEAFERAQIEPQAISYLDICSSALSIFN
jgi:methionine synthase I (cobalamin-dependent)